MSDLDGSEALHSEKGDVERDLGVVEWRADEERGHVVRELVEELAALDGHVGVKSARVRPHPQPLFDEREEGGVLEHLQHELDVGSGLRHRVKVHHEMGDKLGSKK